METYSQIPPATLPIDKPSPCKTTGKATPQSAKLESDEMQISWLRKVNQLLQKEQFNKDDNISWSAHFAHLQYSVPRPPAISGLMPLFRDNAHSVAIVKHGMDVIMKATGHVNPGQIPVLTLDQPLYTIAKEIRKASWFPPNLTTLFGHLSQTPQEVAGDNMEEIERFMVLLYSCTLPIATVNAARKQLFSYGNRKLENIPPSRAALLQHVKHALFQAGYIWG